MPGSEPAARIAAREPVVSALAGLLSGALGAYAYYDVLLRPLAHTLGLWLVVTIAVAARRSPRVAVANATVALAVAVVAFYVGKKVMYGVRYPGMPYPLDLTQIWLWLVLALLAGLGLGRLFSAIGESGRAAAVGTATAAGLLLADALHRIVLYRGELAATVPAVVGLILLAGLTRERRRTLLLVLPASALALLVVAAPDLLEDLVLVQF